MLSQEQSRRAEIATMPRKELIAHVFLCEQEKLEYATEIEKLKSVIRAKDEHIRALRIAKEHEIECHTKSCLEYQETIAQKDEQIERFKKGISYIVNKPIGVFGEGFGWEEHYKWLKDDVCKLLNSFSTKEGSADE
ncbi:hypothetical protein LJK88_20365 [Paenibacillus sp. P26]|nr:hypothetical protein LJK88_20365 [Paenibacillus sp. P26]UUZ96009.1 hypothetical protein LJK87_17495 [Paenibacillus sp. P25]